jgi:parallel beta-helix repeat protein
VDVPGCVVDHGRLIDDWSTRGIYLDDCTSNCLVSGNVIVRAGMGFQVHGGKHNVIENNLIVDCGQALHGCDHPPLRPGNAHLKGMFRGNRFMRNIVYSTRTDALPYSFHAWTDLVMERCDENLFHHPEAPGYRVDWSHHPEGLTRSSFDEWRAMGFDRHSVLADPLFVNPGDEDFRLRADSPALQMGFQPIDVTSMGPRG